jgi:hypothetical protein
MVSTRIYTFFHLLVFNFIYIHNFYLEEDLINNFYLPLS